MLAAQPVTAGFTVPAHRPGAFAPLEQCVAAPGARAFVATLRGAIARRDARALAKLAADDIRLDFGGGAGKADLRARLTGPDGDKLWSELGQATSLGCAMRNGEMVLPWFFAQELGDVDPFDALLVTGSAVPLYRQASDRTPPFARLNWQLVVPQGESTGTDAAERPLRRVSVIGSRLEGYVPSDRLRSQLDYRLFATRVGSGWRVSAFVSGD